MSDALTVMSERFSGLDAAEQAVLRALKRLDAAAVKPITLRRLSAAMPDRFKRQSTLEEVHEKLCAYSYLRSDSTLEDIRPEPAYLLWCIAVLWH